MQGEYSFDETVDRRNTGAIKWDDSFNGGGKPDVIPLWVADMDFPAPPSVAEALRKRLNHPVFGYTNPPADYQAVVAGWYARRYKAEVSAEEVLIAPGMIPSLGIAVRSLTEAGAGILVTAPVYYPFFDIIRDNGRIAVNTALSTDGEGRFRLDFAAMDEAIRTAAREGVRTQAFMLCSPHNPGGRIWRENELREVLEFCGERGLALISDEIHGDIAVSDVPFVSLAGMESDDCKKIAVLGAPNKTFNIAGLHISHFVVRDHETRAAIKKGIAAAGFSQPNVFSITAAHEAYRTAGPWLDALNAYLKENIGFLLNFFAEKIPEAKAVPPEGGYLVWIDARKLIAELGFADDLSFSLALAEEGRVRVNPGSKFGPEGRGCLRINTACPRGQLEEGLSRFYGWISSRRENVQR
ncbi:MAG TPA: PatB family C-S lyase [Treponemataceae bacterium]|nr:PatB family C-S lyase [Treponemataceae bacterium]